jgi:glycosyltransferase involved in cell wall biosynthesis
MRIGIISPPWVPTPPPRYGGTEQIVDILARGVSGHGHDVVLFATGDSTCPVNLASAFDVPPTPMTETVPETFHVIAAYERLADMDVIHDHTTLGPLLSHIAPGVPVVATNHGPFTEETRRIYGAYDPRISLVAISRSQAASAGPGVRVARVIHHGIEVENFPVGQGTGDYVAFLGRMAPAKGAHLAIQAARRAGVPIKLAAKCREEAEIAYFDEFVRPLLGPDAEYVGEIGGSDKLDLLGSARALVNPITWPEPFGLVMTEALACGTPVVTTWHGAAPEIVIDGSTGFLCHNLDEMVDAIAGVGAIDRSVCRQSVEDHFSSNRMVRDHLALYHSLADAGLDLVSA